MQASADDVVVLNAVRGALIPLRGGPGDAALIAQRIGAARLVLLGEASHGTHEFYAMRSAVTKHLIQEKRITAVALEADWPDAYRVNRYVRGADGANARAALEGFKRFPTWMWRNEVFIEFVEWLHAWNADLLPQERVGVYGLDLYSLTTSIRAVLDYLDQVDPTAAQRARYRYACFEHFADDTRAYGYAAAFGLTGTCECDAVNALVDLQQSAATWLRDAKGSGADEYFYIEQNAQLVKNAEEYYRSMFQGRISSWNLRDQHMTHTLQALATHLGEQGIAPRIAVWAHNSHLGDARATEMGWQGELNVGQLIRQRYGRGAVLVGFTTYSGSVTAASDWDAPAQVKAVVPALPESYESLFHATSLPSFMLDLREPVLDPLREPRLERAIGVVYRPESERVNHYFKAAIKDQFDLVVHLDRTTGVKPIDSVDPPQTGEARETFPSRV